MCWFATLQGRVAYNLEVKNLKKGKKVHTFSEIHFIFVFNIFLSMDIGRFDNLS